MTPVESSRLFTTYMAKLDFLKRKHYPEHGRTKELYFAAADCIRTYLNLQYGLDMQDGSMQELARITPRLRRLSLFVEGLSEFFDEYTLVQAGQWLPSMRAARLVPDRVQTLLTQLAPATVREE